MTAIKDGQTFTTTVRSDNGMPIDTTTLGGGAAPIENPFLLDGSILSVFAGHREDPFFFDVEQFFRVRAGAAGFGPPVGFRLPADAVDFTAGYNVNSIVVRVPIAFLQSGAGETTFDVWETILVPSSLAGVR